MKWNERKGNERTWNVCMYIICMDVCFVFRFVPEFLWASCLLHKFCFVFVFAIQVTAFWLTSLFLSSFALDYQDIAFWCLCVCASKTHIVFSVFSPPAFFFVFLCFCLLHFFDFFLFFVFLCFCLLHFMFCCFCLFLCFFFVGQMA